MLSLLGYLTLSADQERLPEPTEQVTMHKGPRTRLPAPVGLISAHGVCQNTNVDVSILEMA